MDNILQENDALRTNLAALEQVTAHLQTASYPARNPSESRAPRPGTRWAPGSCSCSCMFMLAAPVFPDRPQPHGSNVLFCVWEIASPPRNQENVALITSLRALEQVIAL